MPFARFAKMPAEKRERLLTLAAQEFAAHGFEAASLNHILEATQIGKSSAYYYFEDKGDLFGAVVEYCLERLALVPTEAEFAAFTADTFWPIMTERYTEPLLRAQAQPWLLGAVRAAERLTSASEPRESLVALSQHISHYMLTNMSHLIERGQTLGLIRTDVPTDLLVAWFRAIDGASDDWLLARLESLDQAAIRHYAQQTITTLRQALAPCVL